MKVKQREETLKTDAPMPLTHLLSSVHWTISALTPALHPHLPTLSWVSKNSPPTTSSAEIWALYPWMNDNLPWVFLVSLHSFFYPLPSVSPLFLYSCTLKVLHCSCSWENSASLPVITLYLFYYTLYSRSFKR